ncbi:CGNR zinc finger domain-containing protein [Deinococcus aquatilis]|uniref:CGNR zinc finger domain-containing protein n=1 Tax=Deinococcus aquatilis TaxID=519440 RepID=UPI0003663897|nr:ABATE domain-containing protein [Deinococcus aquatilis]
MKASTTLFAFLAERLCLDFANTMDWHSSEHPEERLNTVADLLKWGEDAQLLDAQTRRQLAEYAEVHSDQAEVTLARARELREAIYRVFSAVSYDRQPTATDLETLTQARLEAARHQHLQNDGRDFRWVWDEVPDLRRVWWPVALDAADLLTSDLRHRVGECADDRGCGWLFLDVSKAGRRRWCSMKDCGNRAKAQRHRATADRSRENP